MIHIAVCDDEPLAAETLSSWMAAFFRREGMAAEISPFSSGSALLQSGLTPDAVLLDVRMAPPDGFETAYTLRRRGFSGFLIFVTISREEVFRAFDVSAFDYLVKPLRREDFLHTMGRLVRALRAKGRQLLLVQRAGEQRLVPYGQILYGEAMDRKVYLHLTDGAVLDYYQRIESLEKELDDRFYRCHRSYLLNLEHLQACRPGQAQLTSGEVLPVSRLRREGLSAALVRHIGREGGGL